jgi:hypothetical protein
MIPRRGLFRAVPSIALVFGMLTAPDQPVRAEDPKTGITHAFLATGGETYIRDGGGKVVWTYPHPSRDGWVLPGGNVLLALSKSKTYPGGAVVEVTRGGETVFEFKGTQTEVNTAQKLDNCNVLVS